MSTKRARTRAKAALAALAAALITANGQTQPAELLVNKLVQKGILTESEAKELLSESTHTNAPPPSKWKISDSIKSIGLYGDVRFRYEHRSADNAPGSGESGSTYERDRFRYAVRIGRQLNQAVDTRGDNTLQVPGQR